MPKVKRFLQSTSSFHKWLSPSTSRRRRSTEAQQIVCDLKDVFEKNTNKANAQQMKKYMRDQFDYYGIKSPERRSLTKQVLAAYGTPKLSTIRETLCLAFTEEKRELQMFAIDYAIQYKRILAGDNDKNICIESVECIKSLIITKSWWDTVDMLASNVLGHLVKQQPDHLVPLMDEWIKSENMWLRRSAVIHQLSYNIETDKERLFRYCLLCCHEKEFFIQKAIGWALRNYFRYNPKDVKMFVTDNEEKLARLSVREALKHA